MCSLLPSAEHTPQLTPQCQHVPPGAPWLAASVMLGSELRQAVAFCQVDATASWLSFQGFCASCIPCTDCHAMPWLVVLPEGFFYWGEGVRVSGVLWSLLLLALPRNCQPPPHKLQAPGCSLSSPDIPLVWEAPLSTVPESTPAICASSGDAYFRDLQAMWNKQQSEMWFIWKQIL